MKRLWSAFTEDMDRCYFTGRYDDVERHHIFGGIAYRKKSEAYGYVIPLHASIHPNGARCRMADHERTGLDLVMKQMAQKDFEAKHGTREEFMEIFGRNYL